MTRYALVAIAVLASATQVSAQSAEIWHAPPAAAPVRSVVGQAQRDVCSSYDPVVPLPPALSSLFKHAPPHARNAAPSASQPSSLPLSSMQTPPPSRHVDDGHVIVAQLPHARAVENAATHPPGINDLDA